MTPFRTLGVGLVVAWGLLPAALSAAPVPDKPKAAKEDSPAQKLRKSLEVAVTVDMSDQPLVQILDQLRSQSGVNLVLDKSAMVSMGFDEEDAKLTLRAKQVKLRSALRNLTHQCGLSFGIVGDTILLSTEDAVVARQLHQRVSLELDKVSCADALKKLAKETAVNLVVDPRVAKEAQTPVSVELDEVSLEAAVRLLAEMAGLKPVRVGNVVFVTNKANATSLRADPDLVPRPAPSGVPAEGPGGMNVPGGPIPVPPVGRAKPVKEVATPPPPPAKEGKEAEKPKD